MPSRKKRIKKKESGIGKQVMKHKALIEKYKGDPRKQHTVSYWEKEIKLKFSGEAKKIHKARKRGK